ncbi:MAG: 1-acyl-sn-glycerol-3-phosphate acyltransferase [Bacteroidales bacterium]|nr:1-acyl-sn-glycerol-3-phosphate acyltransferase [Bacteroidales bacterium]
MTDNRLDKQTAENPDKKFVDVDDVFRKKGGKLYPIIPKFLIRYLKRIIHEDELNEALYNYKDQMGLDFLEKLFTERFTAEIEVVNPENIPDRGRYIIASNHPLGGLDGMALMHVVGKKRKDIKFIANDILMELKNLRELFSPVNKHGRNTAEYVKLIDEMYESDQLVLVFPAGLVSRKQKGGIIKDLEWKKSFITKAVRHKRDIIPVYIEGRNSEFFYNMARWRKRLGIKANIEMLYLPDEMFKQTDKKITITFGRPIPYTFFTRAQTHLEWAQWVKEKVYEIGEKPEV